MPNRDPEMRDPEIRTRTTVSERAPIRDRGRSNAPWILGALALLLLLGILAFNWDRTPTNTASTTPNASTPSTTGSAPARPAPAPAQPAAPAR